ncbi:ATP-grasp domain-containing protein [Streptomyces sp. NPDC020472]|uniref:ATP-grasp domain-containing protein n=1 Tax=Streptomyces sp. NPDC020472 TaxID=3365075 RepID=UPI0037A0AA52
MHLLLVGAWPELANCVMGLPARVTLMQTPGTPDSPWPERRTTVDYTDTAEALRRAAELHAADPFDAVAGFRELSLPAVAVIAEGLGIPCVPGPTTSLGHDKAAVRDLLAAGGCRTVRHRVCADPGELAGFVREVGLPVVVKPASGAGSAGVHALKEPGDLAAAWAHTEAAGQGALLAEEMLSGREFSVEVRSVAGVHEVVAVTEKHTTGAPHFVETGHVVPARLTAAERAAVADEAALALTSVGHLDGPSHVEVMLTADGPAVIEINRRLGGDRIWELVQLATGRDLMRESLLDATGAASTPAPHAARAAAIRFVRAPRETTAPEVPTDLDPGAETPGLVRLRLSLPAPGTPVRPMRSSHDRLGYLICVADTPEEADAAADRALTRTLERLFPE